MFRKDVYTARQAEDILEGLDMLLVVIGRQVEQFRTVLKALRRRAVPVDS